MNGSLYLEKLKEAYAKRGLAEQWAHLCEIAHGLSEENKHALLQEYPAFPQSLMEILERIDGTYWREYKQEQVCYFFFGSDVDDGEYPYYLFSCQDILENKDSASYLADLFYDYFEEPATPYGLFIDERIEPDVTKLKWLKFSDCMNNGGTSCLYIDFTPSPKGVKGQIVRYLHDPDELRVIADSFDAFLQMLVSGDMHFIHEDDFE